MTSAAASAAPVAAQRLISGWHRAECWVAMLAFSFIAMMLIYDVAARELIAPVLRMTGFDVGNISIRGAQKMAVYALIVGAFCGIGIATATGAQLTPKVAFGVFPKRWSQRVDRIADIVTFLMLLAIAYYGYVFVASSKAAGMLSSGGIDIPAWIIQSVMPAGFISAALRYALFAIWPNLRPAAPEFIE